MYGGHLLCGLVDWLTSRHRYFGFVGEFGLDAVVLECVDPVDVLGAGLDGGVGVGGVVDAYGELREIASNPR